MTLYRDVTTVTFFIALLMYFCGAAVTGCKLLICKECKNLELYQVCVQSAAAVWMFIAAITGRNRFMIQITSCTVVLAALCFALAVAYRRRNNK